MAQEKRMCRCSCDSTSYCTSESSDRNEYIPRKVCFEIDEDDSTSSEDESPERTDIGEGDTGRDSPCINGADYYGNVLGPTADDSILQGLQTLLNLSGLGNLVKNNGKKKFKVKSGGRARKSKYKKNCCCCRCDKAGDVGVTRSESCQVCIKECRQVASKAETPKTEPERIRPSRVASAEKAESKNLECQCCCSTTEKSNATYNNNEKNAHDSGDKSHNYRPDLYERVPSEIEPIICCDCKPDDLKGKRDLLSCQCLEQIGDCSSECNVRYAITKITKFNHFTTFEIMKSTKKKPKQMPNFLEGVFVLKNG